MSLRKTAWCVRCNGQNPYRRSPYGVGWRCLVCGEAVVLPAKYGNVPTRSKHTGRMFQSKHEASREPVLLALQNAGYISDLRYQVPFRLELYATGGVDELLTEIESGAAPERIAAAALAVRRSRQAVCSYVADFTYRDELGHLAVEDPKGKQTPVYRIKKRLLALAHDLEIVEPDNRGVEQRARGAGVRGRGTGSRLKGGR